MTQIDITKRYKTRDGRAVRLTSLYGCNPKYPVIGVFQGDKGPVSNSWTPEGKHNRLEPGNRLDLIEDTEAVKCTIDTTKQYQTRNGIKVKLYAIDSERSKLIGAVQDGDGEWHTQCWELDGSNSYCAAWSLVPAPPPKVKRWINIYSDDCSPPHASKEKADEFARCTGRVACLEVEYHEGQGL